MPAEFDRCVRALMDDPDFKPRDPNQTKKDAAYAVCTAQYKKRHGGKLPQDDAAYTDSAVMKKEKDGLHPASHYLVVEDPQHPTTWHLRVRDVDGKLNHHLMGAAWSALHEGFRGNKYEGPHKMEAIGKLRRLYKQEGILPPGESSSGIIDNIDELSLEEIMEKDEDLKFTVLLLNMIYGD